MEPTFLKRWFSPRSMLRMRIWSSTGAVVLTDLEVTLNKSTKGSIKVKSTLPTVTEKLVLDGEPDVARHAIAFLDHLVKIRRDGVADPVEDNAVYPNPPWIIKRNVIHDVLDQGVAL
jgi:hypothetical protein